MDRQARSSDTGCACVPHLTAPADRVASLQTLLVDEHEPIVVLTHLLRLCRDEHRTLWEHHSDPRCRSRVAQRIAGVARFLANSSGDRSIPPAAGELMAGALSSDPEIPAVVMAHALAELIDTSYGHVFADWFRQRSPYQPTSGDPVPLDHPDLRRVTDLLPTTPPWRLAHRLDETRRVRLAGAWVTQFRVVFDYGAFDALEGIIGPDTIIATCHPNRDLDELGLGDTHLGPAFPVQPIDTTDQRARLDRLLHESEAAGATVVVLPELCVTPLLAQDLEEWVRRPGPLRVLVAGSYHVVDSEHPAKRSNRALAWVRGHTEPLTQDKHSPADRPVFEGINPTGWPEIRVHVTADGWHIVIAVCRDLLNPGAVHALAEAGVNLVLAPSMTEALMPFGGPVGQLVGTGQAIAAVANNPGRWGPSDGLSVARALFGHPGFAQQTRQVHAGDDEPGIALLHVGSGQLRWISIATPPPPRAFDLDGTDAPAWAERLRPRTSTTGWAPTAVTMRFAAVLVLLIGGPQGPEVLLTRRAAELTHYPEEVVFPGGAADPGDAGPVDTALREAREEIGLDDRIVRILGTLPSMGLPASGFLVTPVLAWTPEVRFLHGTNPAEVAGLHRLPLRPWADGTSEPLVTAVGEMTESVLDLVVGLLHRADRVGAARPQGRSEGSPDAVSDGGREGATEANERGLECESY